ncbi:MAG: hypothetical protein LBN95_05400 [Prevotellaceae bacterium]|jgi:hypothetical protein|nr:hypothetical protein [Prevotellaceae bacterium]
MVQTANTLNSVQLLLLQHFARIQSEQEKDDIQNMLLNYYQKKVDNQADRLWDELNWNNKTVDEILNSTFAS